MLSQQGLRIRLRFLQIESRAWRVASQLRIRKSHRMSGPLTSPLTYPYPMPLVWGGAGQPYSAPPQAFTRVEGPIPRRSPTQQAEGAGLALPVSLLVSLCRFRATFHPGRRSTFGPSPARYGLFPFFGLLNAPQMGPRPFIGPVPGSYGLSPFVDLSVAPQSQAAPRSSRHGQPEKKRNAIQDESNRRRSLTASGARPYLEVTSVGGAP